MCWGELAATQILLLAGNAGNRQKTFFNIYCHFKIQSCFLVEFCADDMENVALLVLSLCDPL